MSHSKCLNSFNDCFLKTLNLHYLKDLAPKRALVVTQTTHSPLQLH